MGNDQAQTGGWRWATILFSIVQALGAYGLSYQFDLTTEFEPLYALGGAVRVLTLALNLLLGKKSLEPQNCFAQAVDFSHHFIAAIDPDGLNQAT